MGVYPNNCVVVREMNTRSSMVLSFVASDVWVGVYFCKRQVHVVDDLLQKGTTCVASFFLQNSCLQLSMTFHRPKKNPSVTVISLEGSFLGKYNIC